MESNLIGYFLQGCGGLFSYWLGEYSLKGYKEVGNWLWMFSLKSVLVGILVIE